MSVVWKWRNAAVCASPLRGSQLLMEPHAVRASTQGGDIETQGGDINCGISWNQFTVQPFLPPVQTFLLPSHWSPLGQFPFSRLTSCGGRSEQICLKGVHQKTERFALQCIIVQRAAAAAGSSSLLNRRAKAVWAPSFYERAADLQPSGHSSKPSILIMMMMMMMMMMLLFIKDDDKGRNKSKKKVYFWALPMISSLLLSFCLISTNCHHHNGMCLLKH